MGKFQKLCSDQRAEGYALDDVESLINRNGNRIYIGLFSKANKRQAYLKLKSLADLKKHNADMEAGGLSLVDVDQFRTNDGKNQYLAIYNDTGQGDRPTQFITTDNIKKFNETRKAKQKAGWQLFDYEEFTYRKVTYCMGVFQKLRKPASWWRSLNWRSLKAHRSHLSRHRGMKLIDLELKKGKGKTHTPATYVSKLKDTPDIWQHMPAIEDNWKQGVQKIRYEGEVIKEFDSDSFCGPTSVSNGIMYWAKNGYPNLNPTKSQIEMVKILGNEKHMDAYKGTDFERITNGLRKYINNHGYTFDHAYIYYIRKPSGLSDLRAMKDVAIKTDLEKISLKTTHKSVINPKSTVILLWGRYEKDKNGKLKRIGGHFVTVVGYGQDKNGKLDKNILIVHDPASSPKNPKQRYLNVKSLVGVDNIRSSTKIYKTNKDGEVIWEDTCQGKQLVRTRTKDGVKRYYVFEGIGDFRIR